MYMRKVNGLFIILFIIIVNSIMMAEATSSNTPEKTLNTLIDLFKSYHRTNTGKELTKQQMAENDKIGREIGEIFDFDSLIKGALQDQWNDMSQQQRNDFFKKFKELIELVAYSQGSYFYNNSDSEFKKAVEDGGKIKIDSLNHNNDKDLDIEITYVFENKNNRWVMTDIYMSKRSLVEAYRMQINRIVGKKGISGLMELLTQKYNDFKKGK